MGHKASTICLHLDLSCAACCASPQVRFISFSSAVTVRRQVFLGRPCFLFPGGVHRRAILGMRSWSILRTCPSHLNRRRLISSTTLLHLVFLYRCALDISLRPEDSTEFLNDPTGLILLDWIKSWSDPKNGYFKANLILKIQIWESNPAFDPDKTLLLSISKL